MSADEYDIYIGADGTVQHVYDDALAGLLEGEGEVRTTRASHVEPAGSGWLADMRPVGGPVIGADGTSDDADWSKVCDDLECQLFPNRCDHVDLKPQPFATRAAALAAEMAWLRQRMGQGEL